MQAKKLYQVETTKISTVRPIGEDGKPKMEGSYHTVTNLSVITDAPPVNRPGPEPSWRDQPMMEPTMVAPKKCASKDQHIITYHGKAPEGHKAPEPMSRAEKKMKREKPADIKFVVPPPVVDTDSDDDEPPKKVPATEKGATHAVSK